VIYERGRFTSGDTEQAAAALAFYAIGLVGYAAIKVLAPAFYALNDARKPMMISLISIVTNYTFNYLLVRKFGFGHRGLALSTSLVALFNFLALLALMRRKIGGVEGARILDSLMRVGAASFVMSIACFFSYKTLIELIGSSGLRVQLANALIPVILGVIVFFAVCKLLRVAELEMAVRAVRRMMSR